MLCPKCKRYMKNIEFKGVEVDRCTNCYGIWFDKFELEDLKKLSGSEVIDIGDTDIGQEQNEIKSAFCPKCRTLMMPETDEQQSHIHYERCPECRGVYFDAGEFRDYKKLTIGEFFKSIFKRDD
ncbi:MAG: zf-TFIIB domain-containing protein [Candidatus Marinimicrobia bacterium]|nr:zf-TFIIB domain-containing protein [Candidatus Neomarinimicrobiota bacterium]